MDARRTHLRARIGGLGSVARRVRVLTHCPPTTSGHCFRRQLPMVPKNYESLTAGWNAYEQSIRDSAAEDDDIVDETFMELQKAMFYQGAASTLWILNKTGLINE